MYFPDYSTFDDVNEGYADLIQKVNSIIDEIFTVKEMCVLMREPIKQLGLELPDQTAY